MIEGTISLAGGLLILATLLPHLRLQDWWIRAFDFPRMQIAVGLSVVLTAQLWTGLAALGDAVFAGLLALCIGEQVRQMLPFTPLAKKQVQDSAHSDPENGIRLLFANVLQTNRDSARLLAIIRERKPDVVLALETDRWWQEALQPLLETYPHTLLQPQDNTYGMLLYSRMPLIDPQVSFLIKPDVPSMHARLKLPSGCELALHCLHPRPPSPTESDTSSERDAELLIVGRRIKASPGPAIVMGDMNDVAWSHTSRLFRAISGLLDPRIGRGVFNTFNAKHVLVRYPLDHFFHTNDFRLVSFRRLGYFGSDHFPVCIHLSHEPDAQAAQPEPQADGDQHEEAREKIAEEVPGSKA